MYTPFEFEAALQRAVSFKPSLAVKVVVTVPRSPPMNATTYAEQRALSLVEIIDFKWLMASDGMRVHVERLQSDRHYAAECLAHASGSRCEALRDAAQRIRRQLGL